MLNNYHFWTLLFENRTFTFYGRANNGKPQFERRRRVPKDGHSPCLWNGNGWEATTGWVH